MNQPQEPKQRQKRPSIQETRNSKGHAEELVDHYWGSINYVFGLIKASELKAGLILSFYGILFSFVYQNVGLVVSEASTYPFFYVLLGLWGFTTVGSIFFSIRCFMPRIESRFNKNIFFFKDVISKYGSIEEFSKTFYRISLDEEQLFDQLGQQVFINSKIASLKFKNVNRSILLLALGLLLLFITAFAHAIIVLG
ncbi:Pycsar system effector family protein [Pelagihabitans pacificus]|uniref:Pycsar system effector family protein n=1 Tax=Pelagihabitans pacificus TaxID=2696054 RepID=UPI001EE89C41|nr:Pycsar system effector family protein [Pelagihabitans pacificus]